MPLEAKEWEKFFELMERIVNGPGDWKEKAEQVKEYANHPDESTLEEFVGWFKDL